MGHLAITCSCETSYEVSFDRVCGRDRHELAFRKVRSSCATNCASGCRGSLLPGPARFPGPFAPGYRPCVNLRDRRSCYHFLYSRLRNELLGLSAGGGFCTDCTVRGSRLLRIEPPTRAR